MKPVFNIARISAKGEKGVADQVVEWVHVLEEDLAVSKELEIFGSTFCLQYIDTERMDFTFGGHQYVLMRQWQVLGTPTTERTGKARCVFFFGNHFESSHDWDETNAVRLLEDIYENAGKGEVWRNIPLLHEFIHELKGLAPFRNSVIGPQHKVCALQDLLRNDVLDKRETPRLYLSMCELCRLYNCYVQDQDEDTRSDYDMDYFNHIDELIYKLSWVVSAQDGQRAQECWANLGGMLRADIVQSTLEWENVIYEVELEVDDQLKGEPRGMGFCYGYWSTKRAALARRGIDWNPPPSINRGVIFD